MDASLAEALVRIALDRSNIVDGRSRSVLDRPAIGLVVEPRLEELLDLTATAGAFEPPRHFAILDHDQGRQVLDREAFDELGMLVAVDSLHRERPMVLPPLQHLSEEGLNPSRRSRGRQEEEAECRSVGTSTSPAPAVPDLLTRRGHRDRASS